MHVLVAMSGGVDSSAAAALLVDAGHQVTGVFLRNGVAAGPRAAAGKQGCCSVGDAADAARVADVLGVAFYSLDFADGFDRIVDDFVRSYAAGRTPNPCVLCNRDLKFGRLMEFADAIGADAVATGHYAAVADRGGRAGLRVPVDRAKDQTYVLFPLGQADLRRTVFPLADRTKLETRAFAARRGLPVADKPESMEICFVPGGDYREVVAARAPHALVPGDVVDEATGAVVGRHAGVGSVTIGQRRGLGVATGEPRFVARIDVARNAVIVGDAASVLRRRVRVAGWNAVAAAAPSPGEAVRGFAKVRRNHAPQPAEMRADPDGGDGAMRVVFDEPVKAPAPGQALVLYDDAGFVLGGGWIAATEA
jgi:tRNA-uridine 2-sulfurtransferase